MTDDKKDAGNARLEPATDTEQSEYNGWLAVLRSRIFFGRKKYRPVFFVEIRAKHARYRFGLRFDKYFATELFFHKADNENKWPYGSWALHISVFAIERYTG